MAGFWIRKKINDELVGCMRNIAVTALGVLKKGQRQLDSDGIEVGVSRQAIEEVIAAYEEAIEELNAKDEYIDILEQQGSGG